MSNTLSWAETALRESGQLEESDLFGREAEPWFGAVIDSRADCARRIFFALGGEHTDGHRFAGDAVSKGSCAAVVTEPDAATRFRQSDTPFFRVKDSLAALQELARAYRKTLDVRVVAVTGSAGKTTTKEYIKAILKRKYRIHSNPGNYNNHIGVPLTILGTDSDNEYLISEVGANHPGEIAFLTELIRPDIGVITNIGDAHIGLFGGRDQIAEAKAELFRGIEPEGYAVLPADDDYIALLRERTGCRVVTFGFADDCTFRVSSVREDEGVMSFDINDARVEIKSFGPYNILNAVAAYAVGDVCGVEHERTREALAAVEPLEGRARVYKAKGIVLVDDSYNANPTSMRASLEALADFPAQRRIAVLGDMGELGTWAESAHRDLGRFIGEGSIDILCWLGGHGDDVRRGFESARKDTFKAFADVDDLIAQVKSLLRKGDAVLVKASRAAQLDRVVSELRNSVLKETRKQ